MSNAKPSTRQAIVSALARALGLGLPPPARQATAHHNHLTRYEARKKRRNRMRNKMARISRRINRRKSS